jgi:hypothetical protein
MSRSKTLKYVLCRPQGGLNDMLCQVVNSCEYGQKFGRKVFIDTAYEHSDTFQDLFARYFVSKFEALVLNPKSKIPALDHLSVYPQGITGQLQTYKASWHTDGYHWSEPNGNGFKLIYDFKKDYDEQLLVHHSAGGGRHSIQIHKYLRVHDSIVDELEKRLAAIGRGYDAIHIRHTDLETDYYAALETLRIEKPKKLFVATDNADVLEHFRSELGSNHVFSFAHGLPSGKQTIHYLRNISFEQRHRNNCDAILDLMMLAFAKKLGVLKTNLNQYSGHSGYGMLAKDFHEDRAALQSFLMRPNLPY